MVALLACSSPDSHHLRVTACDLCRLKGKRIFKLFPDLFFCPNLVSNQLTHQELVQQIRPRLNTLRFLRLVPDERHLIRVVANGTESQARIRADQRLSQLPLRTFVSQRGQQGLHTDRKQRGQHDVENDVEEP